MLRSKEKERDPSKFDAVRYMRHAKHTNFWKQERHDAIATKYIEDVMESTFSDEACDYFYSVVSVYVKLESEAAEKHWNNNFFESMGGKTHVRCACRGCPLIPTNKTKTAKLKCNAVRRNDEVEGTLEARGRCSRVEAFVCSNPLCVTRMCRRCFSSMPTETVTTVSPPANEVKPDDLVLNPSDSSFPANDMEIEDTNAIQPGGPVDDRGDSGEDDSSDDEEDMVQRSLGLGDACKSGLYTLTSVQDPTLDLTEDNCDAHGFMSTDAGDIPLDVVQSSKSDMVAGHVIYNQVGNCLSRRNRAILGTSRQKHWALTMCSTISGTSFPLIQPEASMFPRHFYIASEIDPLSVLGARPLFCCSSKTHSQGMESTLGHSRQRLTDSSSSTGTDPSYLCSVFDELGNISMNHHHSRDVYDHGFVVDDASRTGMSVRDTGATGLSESVDSHEMVLRLSSSQKFIDWSLFLTDTANQSDRPGLHEVRQWIRSLAWSTEVPNYFDMSQPDRDEFDRAMEESAGPHLYSLWNTTKRMFLRYIRHENTVIGRASAIFARDEYQGNAGNLSHNHLILALHHASSARTEDASPRHAEDTSSSAHELSDSEGGGVPDLFSRSADDRSEEREEDGTGIQTELRDMIRTSTLEIIKGPDELNRLLENGLLSTVDGVAEVVECAETVLPHRCDERCLRRVGDGEGPEKFRCRKLHPVKDNPDPTSHAYIPFDTITTSQLLMC